MSVAPTASPPPHQLDAERSVLGAVLLDERHLHALLVDEQLRPEHFYVPRHAAIFAAMLDLYNHDRKIDHLTVAEHLQRGGELEEIGGAPVIEELTAWVPATGHASDYGRIVREHSQLRALLDATYKIQAGVHNREGGARRCSSRPSGRSSRSPRTSASARCDRSRRCSTRRPTGCTSAPPRSPR